MPDLPTFEEARQNLLNTPVEDRVRMFNEMAEAEGDPWRYTAYLPHSEFVQRMRERTAAIKDFSGANIMRWMTPFEQKAFSALFLVYFVLPSVAIIALAIILRRWSILIGLPLAVLAVPVAGAPKKSFIRSCLALIAFVCLITRGPLDSATLILGIPALAALTYRWADDFGDQSLIRFLVRDPGGYDQLIHKGLIMVLVDSRSL